jgi:hypothetical protein
VTKVEMGWLIAALCVCIMLLGVVILMVQVNLQRHLRAHSRALRNGAVQDWRREPTQRL